MAFDLKLFGSKDHPLRASMLPLLSRCPMAAVIKCEGESESGPAADTGSAVHFAVKTWHEQDKSERIALGAMREGMAMYPRADLDVAAQHFLAYARDPANQQAEVVLVEAKIEYELQAATEEEREIIIHGTLDQVRKIDGLYVSWDVKTGAALKGWEMVEHHALQLMAYQLGATQRLGKVVDRAGIIRTKDYLEKKPGPVFWNAPWDHVGAQAAVQALVAVVKAIRRKEVHVAPGPDCRWCVGVAECTRRLSLL